MASETSPGSATREWPFVILASLIALAITFSLFYGTSFFRDMVIVFEGGYRIAGGQVPFRDFYIPGGVVVFYMQALAIWIFGASALSMPAHAGLLAAIVAVMTYRLAREDLGRALSLTASAFMVLSLNGIFGSPHYGFVAYFFFNVVCLLLLRRLEQPVSPGFAAGLAVLSALAILSKQDLLVTVPLVALYLWLSGLADARMVLLAYLAPLAMLLLATAALFQLQGDFLYWFHHGQAPHQSRLPAPGDLIGAIVWDWRFWIALGAIAALLWRRGPADRTRSGLLSVLFLAVPPLVLAQTSGLEEQTRLQGIPLLLLVLYRLATTSERLAELGKRSGIRRRTLTHLAKTALVGALLVLVTPVALLVSLDVNLAHHLGRPSLSGVGDGDVRIDEGAYRGVLLREAAARDLSRIRALIRERGARIVNLSSYAFIYADFDLPPPRDLPLWFDHGITFFDAQLPALTEGLVARKPEVLLLQDAHNHHDREVHGRLRDYFLAHGYERVMRAASPRADRPIDVLVRKR